jgi:hypothetical protein
MTTPIKTYEDFINFKIDMNSFKDNYIKFGGTCSCSKQFKGGSVTSSLLNLPNFLNTYLPAVKGGYISRRKNRHRKVKGGYEELTPADSADFNIFRDVLSVQGNGFQTNTNILNDMTQKVFNYPSAEQNVTRSLF